MKYIFLQNLILGAIKLICMVHIGLTSVESYGKALTSILILTQNL